MKNTAYREIPASLIPKCEEILYAVDAIAANLPVGKLVDVGQLVSRKAEMVQACSAAGIQVSHFKPRWKQLVALGVPLKKLKGETKIKNAYKVKSGSGDTIYDLTEFGGIDGFRERFDRFWSGMTDAQKAVYKTPVDETWYKRLVDAASQINGAQGEATGTDDLSMWNRHLRRESHRKLDSNPNMANQWDQQILHTSIALTPVVSMSSNPMNQKVRIVEEPTVLELPKESSPSEEVMCESPLFCYWLLLRFMITGLNLVRRKLTSGEAYDGEIHLYRHVKNVDIRPVAIENGDPRGVCYCIWAPKESVNVFTNTLASMYCEVRDLSRYFMSNPRLVGSDLKMPLTVNFIAACHIFCLSIDKHMDEDYLYADCDMSKQSLPVVEECFKHDLAYYPGWQLFDTVYLSPEAEIALGGGFISQPSYSMRDIDGVNTISSSTCIIGDLGDISLPVGVQISLSLGQVGTFIYNYRDSFGNDNTVELMPNVLIRWCDLYAYYADYCLFFPSNSQSVSFVVESSESGICSLCLKNCELACGVDHCIQCNGNNGSWTNTDDHKRGKKNGGNKGKGMYTGSGAFSLKKLGGGMTKTMSNVIKEAAKEQAAEVMAATLAGMGKYRKQRRSRPKKVAPGGGGIYVGKGKYHSSRVRGRGEYDISATGGGHAPEVTNTLMSTEAGSLPDFKHLNIQSGGDIDDNSMIVTYTETIGVVYAPDDGGFNSAIYEINPGLANVFPFLSGFAANFTRYDIRQLIFQFEPLVSAFAANNQAGQIPNITMAVQHDVSEAKFKNKMAMLGYQDSRETTILNRLTIGKECNKRKNGLADTLFVRTGPPPINPGTMTAADAHLYDGARRKIRNGYY